MRLLATGLTGFVGSYVQKELGERGMLRDATALSSGDVPGVRTIPSHSYAFGPRYLVDSGCGEVEVLVHLGAWTPKTRLQADDVSRAASNVSSTASLLEACKDLSELRHVVYASTIDVYGSPDDVVDELTAPAPETLYGWSKIMCERMVESFCKAKGVSCMVLRLGHVYGPGEEAYRKAMPSMMMAAAAGEPVKVIGDGAATRSYVHASDVARAIVNAAECDESLLVNVVGEEAVDMDVLASRIAGFAGMGVERIPDSAPRRDFVFNATRLKETLLPSQVPFAEGLRDEFEHFSRSAGR